METFFREKVHSFYIINANDFVFVFFCKTINVKVLQTGIKLFLIFHSYSSYSQRKLNILLIFDEIQTCFGRTGKLFALETYGVTPDILCIAKGMGGGMPIGAFISSKEKMDTLKDNPKLGHITTFGGHPVSCAAASSTLEIRAFS